MKRLGKVLHISKGRGLIVKLEARRTVRVGDKTYDSDLNEVGIINDIFGPTRGPYVAISSTTLNPEAYVGKTVYVKNA